MIYKKLPNILFIASLLVGFAHSISAQVPLTDETRDRIELHLKVVEAEYGIVGQSLAILKNGTLVYTGARGLSSIELNVEATDKTVYQVFSLAKLFVHVTLMQLVESDTIELDAPISRYLHELPESWRNVTVRQAMSHTSGLPEYYKWPNPTPKTQQEAIRSVADKVLEFKTGSTTRYNQTNYLLLKMMIESVTDGEFLSIVTTRMIDELKLESTLYGGEYAVVPGRATTYRSTPSGLKRNVHIDQPDYMFASSGLNTNVVDLATWFSALLNYRFISQETMESMWTPLLLDNGTVANFTNGWEFTQFDGVTVVGHGGGNRADVRHYFGNGTDENVTVIYFTNGSERNFWPGNVSADIAKLVMTSVGSARD